MLWGLSVSHLLDDGHLVDDLPLQLLRQAAWPKLANLTVTCRWIDFDLLSALQWHGPRSLPLR